MATHPKGPRPRKPRPPRQSLAEIGRRSKLKRAYGITPEDYDRMFDEQGGVCAICGNPPQGIARHLKVLHIDHDHGTGRIRALLCDKCNVGLGSFRDNPDLLRAATRYLEAFDLG